jgi:hypothetical protein
MKPSKTDKLYKQREKDALKAIRQTRWRRKTTAQKFADIWIRTLGWTILTACAGLLISILVVFAADSKIPLASKLIVALIMVIVGISVWALEQG